MYIEELRDVIESIFFAAKAAGLLFVRYLEYSRYLHAKKGNVHLDGVDTVDDYIEKFFDLVGKSNFQEVTFYEIYCLFRFQQRRESVIG